MAAAAPLPAGTSLPLPPAVALTEEPAPKERKKENIALTALSSLSAETASETVGSVMSFSLLA